MTENYKEYKDEGQERGWKTTLELLAEQEEKSQKQAVVRNKIVEMFQDPSKSKSGEPLELEMIDFLIDSCADLSDEELGDCINPNAVAPFRKLVAYLNS